MMTGIEEMTKQGFILAVDGIFSLIALEGVTEAFHIENSRVTHSLLRIVSLWHFKEMRILSYFSCCPDMKAATVVQQTKSRCKSIPWNIYF